MRIIPEQDYIFAKAVLEHYTAYCRPYVKKNGWTVIEQDAPRFFFRGEHIDTDGINAHSTTVELYTLLRDKPDQFSAYVTPTDMRITTWTGEKVAEVINRGPWHVNNLGGRWRSVDVRADWGRTYHGREYSSRNLINLKAYKGI